MPVVNAKPAVKIAAPARPAPVVAKPATQPPPVPPSADVTGAEGDDDPADDAKPERKKRSDFATWEEFCDYKVAMAEAAIQRYTERAQLWRDKKVNKDADVAAKKEKKAEKLIAAYIKVQQDLGVPDAIIQKAVEEFKKNLAAATQSAA